MTCPLDHGSSAWCLDCKYAKEGLCDWPHKVGALFLRNTGGKYGTMV